MNKNSRKRKLLNRKAIRTGSKEVISQNPRRNMEMRVVKGYDENQVNFSRTVHCKIWNTKPSFPKQRRGSGFVPQLPTPKAPVPGEEVEEIPEVV